MKPNQNTISRIADFLDYLNKVGPGDFNMFPADKCIGGHCAKLLTPPGLEPDYDHPGQNIAELFGIPLDDGNAMAHPGGHCSPDDSPHSFTNNAIDATIPEVASMLDHYAGSGIVDWPRAMGETWQ